MTTMEKDEKIKAIKDWLGAGSINIFGSPFSGKDTQGQKLAELLGTQCISSGDMLRVNTKPDEVKNHMGSGFMFPTESFKQIVFPYLNQPTLSGKPLILSSIGRWYGEEKDVMRAATESGHSTRTVIFLQLTEDEVWKRWELSKQLNDRDKRYDDSKEALATRLEEFKNKTLPVIEFYRGKGLLIEVNGNQAPNEVTNEIIEKLYAFSRTST
jgi:adenylate kinase